MNCARLILLGCTLLALSLPGCASSPSDDFEKRRERVEARIDERGQSNDPRIEAARDALEAPLERARGVVIVDGVEVRAEVLHERDDKTRVLARVPIKNLFQIPTEKRVHLAEMEIALTNLEGVSLDQRVRACMPSLEWLVYNERQQIYEAFATRQQALLDRNHKLRNAGAVDEVRAMRFELIGEVDLSRRTPELPPTLQGPLLPVLPDLERSAGELMDEPRVIHVHVEQNQPAIEMHRAQRRRLDALSEHEAASRWPAPRFVDLSVEPEPFPGDDRQIAGQVAFEIPFGFEARARSRQYDALARSEQNEERATLAQRTRAARDALATVNAFRRRADDWITLLANAAAAEDTADRWFANRRTRPSQISDLLGDVYSARMTALDARETAGRAGCALLEATGTPIEDWPERP